MMEDQQRYRDALAQYLVSEKDTRPYADTYHRGFSVPGGVSGYNNAPVTSNSDYRYMIPSIAGGSAWGFLHDIMQGKSVTDQEIKDAASDAAGAAMTGGFALGSRPQNSVGMFAGRTAKTADHQALARTEQLDAAGTPREQIWNDTGWFRGVDGKWRFEIDDSTMPNIDFVPDRAMQARNFFPTHDLHKAYPDHPLDFKNDPLLAVNGSYASTTVSPSGRPVIGLSPKLDQDAMRSAFLHEAQHSIPQRVEGFAYGGSMFDPNYHLLAGEVEARTVQARKDLTADQRRARPPWLDYDVPEAQQIVRFDNEGPALSRPSGSIGSGGRARELPVDQASRMARAKEMGFDTDTTWYHGTNAKFDEFRPSGAVHAAETASDIKPAGVPHMMGEGVYLTKSADYANEYGNNIMPLMVRGKVASPSDIPAEARGGLLSRLLLGADHKKGADWARQNGYSGYYMPDGLGELNVFDPRNIRSVSAAFDPDMASSANLLAANAPTSAAAPSLQHIAKTAAQEAPGIRYLDQGSRGAGEGSRNYVVFDDNIVEILRKYGLAGLFAGMGAMGANQPGEAQ